MILNFDACNDHIPIISTNIRRTEQYDVVTKSEVRTYKPNAEKRKFLENYDSVPYGYKIAKFE